MHRRLALALSLFGLSSGCRAGDPPPAPAAAPSAAAPSVDVHVAAPSPGGGGMDERDERAAYIRTHYTKYEYRIPMRDGARLFTAVYVPSDAGPGKKYPFLMTRTPYSVAPYGEDRYAGHLAGEALEREGYIFVGQDVRGKNMSEGEFVDVRPAGKVDESTDTYDTIAWLLAHVPNHNGKVGMLGTSYPGFYTSAGAINGHPALVAISPQAPVSDWWHGDDMHRNGCFTLQEFFDFFSRFGVPRPAPIAQEHGWKPFPYGTPDAWRFFRDLGGLGDLDASDWKNPVPFYDEVRQHPNYDDFWKARNIFPRLTGIKAATLVVGGWWDTENLYGALGTYQAIRTQNRVQTSILMGPWRHGAWNWLPGDRLGDDELGFATTEKYKQLIAAFFAHHLKGAPDPKIPAATVFEIGPDRWRTFDAWPPKGVKAQPLYLREGGGLAADAPGAAAPPDEYVSDPNKPVPYTARPSTSGWSADYMAEDQRFAAMRPDVLVYQTPPLEHDVTVAGPIDVELYVSSTGTDADFVVKLIDVNPGVMPGWDPENDEEDLERGIKDRGEQQTLVRGEPFRARWRNSDAQPEPLVPDQVAKLAWQLDDTFHTFQRGHRIMIQVQSSWFPFVDRNPQKFVPNIFDAKAADFVTATNRVHHAPGEASVIRLPVLPQPDE